MYYIKDCFEHLHDLLMCVLKVVALILPLSGGTHSSQSDWSRNDSIEN